MNNRLLSTPELLAEVVAANALPLFFSVLTGGLVLAWALALSWRATRPAGGPPRPRIVVVGSACLLSGVAAFAWLASAVVGGHALTRFDDALVAALRATQTADTLRVFARITHFGDTAVLTALGIGGALLLAASGRRLFAAGWAAAIGGNSLLNHGLKSVFERVRPLHEHGHSFATGWSFPSGHSSGTVVAWGIAAYVLMHLLPPRWHLPALFAAVAIALSTALSRIFLQVHYASDVLAGIASGSAWLSLCIVTIELLRARFEPPCNHPPPALPQVSSTSDQDRP